MPQAILAHDVYNQFSDEGLFQPPHTDTFGLEVSSKCVSHRGDVSETLKADAELKRLLSFLREEQGCVGSSRVSCPCPGREQRRFVAGVAVRPGQLPPPLSAGGGGAEGLTE